MADMRHTVLYALISLFTASFILADDVYRKPPQEIVDVLNAPPTPEAVVSPANTQVLLIERILYPPISDLAQPMLRLAGVRINPSNNGPHSAILYRSATLQRLDTNSSSAGQIKLALPPDAKITEPIWSPDGSRFAFTNITEDAVELWTGDANSGQIHKLNGIKVNAALNGFRMPDPIQWMPDGHTLLVQTVRTDRGSPPNQTAIPPGPHTQESAGRSGPVRTYEDMLKNAYDEDLFDYYATAQLEFIDSRRGTATPCGQPGIFLTVNPSPDGQDVLVARVRKPYSYLHPVSAFPKDVEVWDRSGQLAYKVASLPLEDRVPIEGVPTGPRDYNWLPTDPHTLDWVEALDGGNPKENVPYRDRIMLAKISGSKAEPQELMKVQQRFEEHRFR